MGVDIRNLHPLEVRVLRHVEPGSTFCSEDLVDEIDMNTGQCNQALSWLAVKELAAEDRREESTYFELTELGEMFTQIGPPFQRIFELVREVSGLTLPQIADKLELEKRDAGSAFGMLSKLGHLSMDEEKRIRVEIDQVPPVIEGIKALLTKAVSEGP
ncbi:MAG: phenylalanine--tRNA ligase subunit alpha, partial [Spirochaetales bacterium]|nr:phenylalanine--tRNA ligase subunit alpha [Spirochaetales bacterium]